MGKDTRQPVFATLLILLCGCGGTQPAKPPAAAQSVPAKPESEWKAQLGKEVTIEGVAENWKAGPQVSSEKTGIWIDGPEWNSEMNGKRVRVTGTVIERADLPVFIADPNDGRVPGGIPVPRGTDLKEAAKRFLLTNIKWELLETKPQKQTLAPPKSGAYNVAMKSRLHVFFSGHVQGVGFRFTTAQTAKRFAVTGWVRNLYDGRVEMKAEGEGAELDRFLDALETEMRGNIESRERSNEPATGEWDTFTVAASS